MYQSNKTFKMKNIILSSIRKASLVLSMLLMHWIAFSATSNGEDGTIIASKKANYSINNFNEIAANTVTNTTTGLVYTTIQAAIDDPLTLNGHTLNVSSGTFSESININKSLTLNGANVNVCAKTDRLGLESIIDCPNGIGINASNVIINGFTIQNQVSQNTGPGFGFAIYMGPSTTGTQILNNIIKQNIVGCAVSNTGATQVVISCNWFDSNNNAGAAGGTGIYADEYTSSFSVNNVLIDNNKFTNNQNGGIDISVSQAAFAATEITISNNAFDGNRRALFLYYTNDSEFINNEITNSTGTGTGDVRIYGGVNDLNILHNKFVGSSTSPFGVRVTNDGGIDNSAITISYNSFVGYSALISSIRNESGYIGALPATCNWYNQTVGGLILLQNNGNLQLSPWLVDGTDNSTAFGFQEVPGSCSGVSSTNIELILNELNSVGALNGNSTNLNTFNAISNDSAFYSFCNSGGLRIQDFFSHYADFSPNLFANVAITLPAGLTMSINGTATPAFTTNIPAAAFPGLSGTNITFTNTVGGKLTATAKIIAFLDNNSNGAIDPLEAQDSLFISVEVGQVPTATVCKDINVSIDSNTCQATITPLMIGEGYACESDFDVFLIGTDGLQVPNNTVTTAHIGLTLKARLINTINGNYCWANVKIEDKVGPTLVCPPNLSVYCGQETDLLNTGNVSYHDCSPIKSSTFSDYNTSYKCLFPDTIIRTFIVTDKYNNVSKCYQKISLTKPPLLSSLVFIDNDTLYNCGTIDIRPKVTGYPALRVQDAALVDVDTIILNPNMDPICNLRITYFDATDTLCSINTRKVLRTWMIEDRCNWVMINQWIYVLDTVKPYITPSTLSPLNVTTSIGSCSAYVTIPPVGAYDDCSSHVTVNTSVLVITPLGDSIVSGVLSNGGYINQPIKAGRYTIRYTVTDACGNYTTKDRSLVIEDKSQPVAICRTATTINLVGNTTTPIPAKHFDEGSYDCCIDRFEVKRMSEDDTLFRPSIVFDCNDLTEMVVMRVWDCSGNYNTCMVNVNIQDKVKPNIYGLPNLSIECTALDNKSLTTSYLDNKFGKIVVGSATRDSIRVDKFNDGTNNLVGVGIDGYATDNCGTPVITETFIPSINSCGIGTIIRTFTVTDKTGLRDSVKQYITINNSKPFFINTLDPLDPNDGVIWPKDSTLTPATCSPNLDPSVMGRPVITESSCDQVLVSYKDEVFKKAPNSNDTLPCFKLLRTWTIIDWCQYQGTGGGLGRWEYQQVIKVFDNTSPTISSAPAEGSTLTYGFISTTCIKDSVLLPQFTAVDACVSQTVLNGNKLVTTDFPLSSRTTDQYLFVNVPAGTYSVRYLVEDDCGNSVYRNFFVTVKDTKKPTPVCRLSSIDIMPTGMVRMDSIHVNNFSNDNCTPSANLKFRLTRGVSNNPDTLSNSIIFDCNDVCNSPVLVYMYVGDQSGNWDYCVTTVQVQDNIIPNVCSCSSSNKATIAGAIKTEVGEDVQDVNVKISSNSNFVTSTNGLFQFPNLNKGTSYTVEPEKDMEYMNGVSTADLVAINKHILSITPFNSAYKQIAADVNKDGKISTADMVELRKMILFINDKFPNGNKSWRFVDKNYQFNSLQPLKESFTEILTINNLASNVNADFVGIKVGDVNNSATPNNLVGTTERSNETVTIKANNKAFNSDETVNVAFDLDQIKNITGLQFTLNFDQSILEFVGIKQNTNQLASDDNFGLALLDKGVITFSWNTNVEATNTTLFELVFKSKARGQLSNSINISSRYTTSEAYTIDKETVGLNLKFSGKEDSFTLFQNQPNPFDNQTVIGFNLPEASKATLSIIDLSGKVVKEVGGNYFKGYNEIIIRNSDLPSVGVYHYQLRTDAHTASKKLIVIE